MRRKSINDNEKMECSNGFPFHQFVSIIDESENQTVEDWGNAIVKELNDSKKLFKYPTSFFYGGDMTDANEKEEPPLAFLLYEDLFCFAKDLYFDTIIDGSFPKDVETQQELFGEKQYKEKADDFLQYADWSIEN